MKVRSGFVSNSSSSNYIVEVPKDFVVNEEMLSKSDSIMDELWMEEILDEEGEINKKAVDLINNKFNQLKNGKNIRFEYDGPNLFQVLIEILEKNDFVIMTTPGYSGSGEDVIMPLKDRRKKK